MSQLKVFTLNNGTSSKNKKNLRSVDCCVKGDTTDGFKIKSPIPGERARQLLENASKALIRSQINYHRFRKSVLLRGGWDKGAEGPMPVGPVACGAGRPQTKLMVV